MTTFILPFEDRIDRSSGPSKEGFSIDVVQYSGKISQRTYSGPSQAASREEEWNILWKNIEYNSPEEVAAGAVDELGQILEFYKQAYLGRVSWRPFEFSSNRIWEIVPDSLKRKNVAGCIFEVTISLTLLYTE